MAWELAVLDMLCIADHLGTHEIFTDLCAWSPYWQSLYVGREATFDASPAADLSDAQVAALCASDLHTDRLYAHGPVLQQQAAAYAHQIRRAWSFFDAIIPPGVTVLLWNGFPRLLACAAAVAREKGCRVLFCENGTIPLTWACGTGGANGASDFARLPADAFRARAVNRERLDALYARAWAQRETLAHTLAGDGELPDGPFILYAGQVRDDTQLTALSPRYPSQLSAICATWDALMPAGLSLVVKPHPYDIDGSVLQLHTTLPDLTVIVDTPIRALLTDPRCRAVVTVNSSVGLEALVLGVPVVTLGRSIYDVLTHSAVDRQIAEAINDALNTPPDRALLGGYLDAMLDDHVVDYHDAVDGEEKYTRWRARLLRLMGTPPPGDPGA